MRGRHFGKSMSSSLFTGERRETSRTVLPPSASRHSSKTDSFSFCFVFEGSARVFKWVTGHVVAPLTRLLLSGNEGALHAFFVCRQIAREKGEGKDDCCWNVSECPLVDISFSWLLTSRWMYQRIIYGARIIDRAPTSYMPAAYSRLRCLLTTPSSERFDLPGLRGHAELSNTRCEHLNETKEGLVATTLAGIILKLWITSDTRNICSRSFRIIIFLMQFTFVSNVHVKYASVFKWPIR